MECSCPLTQSGGGGGGGQDLTEPSEFARAQMERRPWVSKVPDKGQLARAGLSGKLIDDVRSLKYPQGEFTPSLISLLAGQMCKRATQGARATKGPAQTVRIMGAGTLWFSGQLTSVSVAFCQILLKYAFVLKGSLFKRLLAFASEMPETQVWLPFFFFFLFFLMDCPPH
jgi:hypothetical protein